MEKILVDISTKAYGKSYAERYKMMDYSEYLLRISKMMALMHKAAQANNNQAASDLAAEVARYAISLSAYFEAKTETVV